MAKQNSKEELVKELANLSIKDIEIIVRQAKNQRREAKASAEERKAKESVVKIPKQTLNSLARRIKELT